MFEAEHKKLVNIVAAMIERMPASEVVALFNDQSYDKWELATGED